jgi:hypothetical protein
VPQAEGLGAVVPHRRSLGCVPTGSPRNAVSRALGSASPGRCLVSRLHARACTNPVRVVADDPGLLDDLADFLGRLGCEVEKAVDSLEVSIPFVPEVMGERVLGLFLSNWRGGKATIE